MGINTLKGFWVAPDNLLYSVIDLSILFGLILSISILSRYLIKNYITEFTSIIFSEYLFIEFILSIIIVVLTYPIRYWLIENLKINIANLKNYYLDDKVVYIGILGVIYSSSLGTIRNSIMATTSIFLLSILSGYNNNQSVSLRDEKQSRSYSHDVLSVHEFSSSSESLSDFEIRSH